MHFSASVQEVWFEVDRVEASRARNGQVSEGLIDFLRASMWRLFFRQIFMFCPKRKGQVATATSRQTQSMDLGESRTVSVKLTGERSGHLIPS